MKFSRTVLFAHLLAIAALVAISPQAPAAQAGARHRADRAAVIAVVRAALDAIRDADRKKFASLELDGYRIVSLQGPTDQRHIFEQSARGAADSAQARKPGAWRVRPLSTQVLLDPNGMAVVWVPYIFYLDGLPQHCGVESWTLFRVAGKWKVINFADTDNTLHGRSPAAVCRNDAG